MNDIKHEAFLKKIGVEIPQPRVMEGFGTELPEPYLERCLSVIVPATEEYIRKVQESVVNDFMEYVKRYKGVNSAVPASSCESKPVEQKPVATNTPHQSRTYYSKQQIQERVLEIALATPNLPAEEFMKKLGVSRATVYRARTALIKENRWPGPTVFPKVSKKEKANDTQPVVEDEKVAVDSLPTKEEIVKKVETVEKAEKAEKVEKEPIPVATYKEGGYMAGIRARFENRDKAVPAVPFVTPGMGSKGDNLKFSSFYLQSFFKSMSAADREKATKEFWNIMPEDASKVLILENKFASYGIRLYKTTLTKLEYAMLTSVIDKRRLSAIDMANQYSEWLRKA